MVEILIYLFAVFAVIDIARKLLDFLSNGLERNQPVIHVKEQIVIYKGNQYSFKEWFNLKDDDERGK